MNKLVADHVVDQTHGGLDDAPVAAMRMGISISAASKVAVPVGSIFILASIEDDMTGRPGHEGRGAPGLHELALLGRLHRIRRLHLQFFARHPLRRCHVGR